MCTRSSSIILARRDQKADHHMIEVSYVIASDQSSGRASSRRLLAPAAGNGVISFVPLRFASSLARPLRSAAAAYHARVQTRNRTRHLTRREGRSVKRMRMSAIQVRIGRAECAAKKYPRNLEPFSMSSPVLHKLHEKVSSLISWSSDSFVFIFQAMQVLLREGSPRL